MDRGGRLLAVAEAASNLAPVDARRGVEFLAATVKSGSTVIMVTHKLSEVLEATSRVVAIVEGRILSDALTKGLDRAALVQMLVQQETSARGDLPGSDDGARETLIELRDVHAANLGPVNPPVDAVERCCVATMSTSCASRRAV